MKYLADEGVDSQVVGRLRADGLDVGYVAAMEPGISDDLVLERAGSEGWLLINADKDFGELVFRMNRQQPSVVRLRIDGLPAWAKAELVSDAFRNHASRLAGAFSVLTPGTLRVRPALRPGP